MPGRRSPSVLQQQLGNLDGVERGALLDLIPAHPDVQAALGRLRGWWMSVFACLHVCAHLHVCVCLLTCVCAYECACACVCVLHACYSTSERAVWAIRTVRGTGPHARSCSNRCAETACCVPLCIGPHVSAPMPAHAHKPAHLRQVLAHTPHKHIVLVCRVQGGREPAGGAQVPRWKRAQRSAGKAHPDPAFMGLVGLVPSLPPKPAPTACSAHRLHDSWDPGARVLCH